MIELQTSRELGTFETEAEAAACLVFAGLRPDQVEVRANVPLLAIRAQWTAHSRKAVARRGRVPPSAGTFRNRRPSGCPGHQGAIADISP